MEGRRAAAIVALCMLMLLSGQLQQVAGMSKFCACYKQCYPDCRKHLPVGLCVLKCLDDCSPNKAKVDAPTSAADCSKICLTSICGTAATEATGAAACVDDCTKNWGQYAKYL